MPVQLFRQPSAVLPADSAFLTACSATLFANIQAGGVILDHDQQIVQVNQQLCDILELDQAPADFAALDVPAFVMILQRFFSDTAQTADAFKRAMDLQQVRYNQEWALSDGRMLEWDYTPIMQQDQLYGHLWLCRDVTWWIQSEQLLRIQTEQLRQLAFMDGLTEVSNRRHIVENAQRELRRARRSQRELSLILFDVDHFKRVNDTWGHAIGDEVLRWIAGLAAQAVRNTDFIGRYGGEEFLILLPEADADAARMIAERLRRMICETPFESGSIQLTISVSLGVTTVPPGSDAALDAYLRYADTAMYAAKAQGRNCLVFEPDPRALVATL